MDLLRASVQSSVSARPSLLEKPSVTKKAFDLRMTSTLDAKESGTHISLVEFTRLQPPAHYQAPLRSTIGNNREVHEVLFDRIKAASKSSVPQTNLSKKADYQILASSTGRAGDSIKAAVSHYNLGVVADNAFRFKRAIECYKKFVAAVRAASKEEPVAATLSARARASGNSPLLSSRTSRSAAGAGLSARMPADLGASHLSQASTTPSDIAVRTAEALGFNALAISAAAAGDLESSLLYHAEHAKVAPQPQGRVIALVNAGIVHRRLNNLEDSDACFQGALKLAISQRDDAGEMLAAGHLGLNAVVPVPLQHKAQDEEAAWPSHMQPTAPSDAPPATRPHRFVRGRAPPSAAAHAPTDSNPPHSAAQGGGSATAASSQQQCVPRCLAMEPLALDRAKEALSTLLQLHAKGDDPRNVCRGHSALGTIAFAKGLLQDAAAHFNEAHLRGQEAGEGGRAALDRCHLGMALASQQMQAYMAAVGQGAKAVARMQLPQDAPAVQASVGAPAAPEAAGEGEPGAAPADSDE